MDSTTNHSRSVGGITGGISVVEALIKLLLKLAAYLIFVVIAFILIVGVAVILPVAMWVYVPIHVDLKSTITLLWVLAMIAATIFGLEVLE